GGDPADPRGGGRVHATAERAQGRVVDRGVEVATHDQSGGRARPAQRRHLREVGEPPLVPVTGGRGRVDGHEDRPDAGGGLGADAAQARVRARGADVLPEGGGDEQRRRGGRVLLVGID